MNALSLLLLALVSQTASAGWTKEQTAGVEYWFYKPEAAGPIGLMVSLHGCVQTADDLKKLGNWEATAEHDHLAVALPYVPNGGVVLGCWDYYGKDQNAGNRDNGAVIGLTEALLGKSNLAIQKDRVYISGVSSGAGQAMLEGCLRPDLYRGVGLSSSPAAGTGAFNTLEPNLNAHEVADFCRSLAQGRSFAGQQISLIHGDRDFVVNPKHSQIIEGAYREIFGLQPGEQKPLSSVPGTNLKGTLEEFRDAAGDLRLSVIVNDGIGHAWPAGSGDQNKAEKYVMPFSVNYPAYLGSFFAPLGNSH